MAHHIIHRNADAFRIALIMKAGRNASHLPGEFFDPPVQFFRGDSFLHKRSNIIKHHGVSPACFPDSRNLFRCLYHLMIRHFISTILKIFDPVIKRHMTGFILFTAATPAFIISSKFQFLLPPGYNRLPAFSPHSSAL